MARSTARDLITGALRSLNAIDQITTPSAEDASFALDELNTLIESWNLDNLWPYTQQEETLSFVSGTDTYTIGSGGDIDTTRPDEIKQVTLTVAGTTYDIPILSNYDFNQRTRTESISGYPSFCRYLADYPLGSIQFYPPPSGESCTIIFDKLISNYSLNDTISLPSGYWGALQYGLAERLTPTYGTAGDPNSIKIAQQASTMKKRLEVSNYETRELKVPKGRKWDIDSNEYRTRS